MTPEELTYRSERAKQLEADSLLIETLQGLRKEALDALAMLELSEGNMAKAREYQAIAAVCEEIPARLKSYIIAAGEQDGGVTV